MKITREFLLSVAPGANPSIVDGIVAAAPMIMSKYGILTDQEICHFIGQTAEETGGYTRLEENLFYTSTARLRQVWPSRFKTDAAAAPYLRNPSKLANLVYNGRMGNRAGSGDGYDYRGSGDLQTTGRTAFLMVDKANPAIGALAHPDRLRTHPAALESAAIFWRDNALNSYADANDIVGLTKRLNGGLTNLADRRLYTDRATRAAKAAPVPAPDTTGWLRKGASGTAVAALQRRLQQLRYYQGGKIDATFGDGTDDAVRHFQTDHALIADGVVGPSTEAALAGAVASPVDPHTNPPSGPLVPATPAPGLGALLLQVILAIIAGLTGRK